MHKHHRHQNELTDLLLEAQRIHRGQYTNDGDAVCVGAVWPGVGAGGCGVGALGTVHTGMRWVWTACVHV